MTRNHELDRTKLADVAAPHHENAIAPGRATRSNALVGPTGPMPSGIILRKARDANGVEEGAGDAVARAASSTSAPLPEALMRKFEASLGADLSGVRVHSGGASVDAASAVGAKAYTVGQDIHFGAGHFDPSSASGEHLLAHEVAHTVQQRGSVARMQTKLSVSSPGDAFEHEADHAADAMVAGRAASISGASGVMRQVMRDADDDMVSEGKAGGDNAAHDMAVEIITAHTTVDDENEAKAVLAQIDAAEGMVARHPTKLSQGGNGPSSDRVGAMLVENHDARFVIEQYLATVSDSGNFQSQYAASYQTTKRDYGTVFGQFGAFLMAGGKLDAGSQADKMAALTADPVFAAARGRYEQTRDELATDKNKISEGQAATSAASSDLMAAIFSSRAAAAKAVAKKNQDKLNNLMTEINDAVSIITTVGQVVATATAGALAMGEGGFDMNSLVEVGENGAPPPQGPQPATGPLQFSPPRKVFPGMPGGPTVAPCPSLAPPSLTAPVKAPTKTVTYNPNDTRAYAVPPAQTLATAKSLGSKAVSALGGPKQMLTTVATMLEQSKIDGLQAQINAANEDGNLNDAAAAASTLATKRAEYQAKLTTLVDDVGNLLAHKQQLDTATNDMVKAAKAKGASKDLTGAIRIMAAGDKFLSQVDLTISLGEQQQAKGKEARAQRYNIIDGAYSTGTAQGQGQVHYWTVASQGGEMVGTRHNVDLKASGKDSLMSDRTSNSTQFDVGKSIEELQQWKADIQDKRDQAQNALGMTVGAGHS